MKNLYSSIFLLLLPIMVSAQTQVTLSVDGRIATATLADNPACRELAALLENGPINILMSDYGGFEKVGELPQSFTRIDSQISTGPGDIMLYQGNQMVIFYGTNSWSYTPLGKVDDATAESVRQFLGNGNITLTISLLLQSAIDELTASQHATNKVYDLKGSLVTTRPLNQGIYIINGKKTLVNGNSRNRM